METVLRTLAQLSPILFAVAFLGPVIDQGMQALGLAAPLGVSTLTFALLIGGAWGLFAQMTGRWI